MKNLNILAMIYCNICVCIAFHNNVCKSLPDYYTNLDQNKNCYYNPDGELLTPDIIKRQGYPVETYKVTTDDGYILTIFRIPHSKNSSMERIIRKPIFLQHGITLNSAYFVNIGQNSLGFYLSDAGYDVWFGNMRGNKYSMQHQTLNSSDDAFWNYSFHEHGLYDLPAQLDFVKQVTKQKVIYIGYSLGNTAAFVYGSLQPKLASENIKYFIALGPGVYLQNIWNQWYIPLAFQIFSLIKNPTTFQSLLQQLCFRYPFQVELCAIMQMFIEGFGYDQLIPEILPIIFRRDFPGLKEVAHLYQMTAPVEFKQYDYGSKQNLLKYGSSYPPEYNLSNINFPVQLIAAPNDQIATVENAKKLFRVLPKRATQNTRLYIIKSKQFNHSSLLVGKDAKRFVFDIILRFLSQIV